MLGWVVKNMHICGECMAGFSKVCIFTVGAQLACQTYAFLQWVRCMVVKRMHFYGGCAAGLTKHMLFYDKCAPGLLKVCIFTVDTL